MNVSPVHPADFSASPITLSLEPLKVLGSEPSQAEVSPAPVVGRGELPLPERYTYERPLGRGGMGEVHRVFDRYLNRPLALKVIQPRLVGHMEAQSRFLAEAQTTAQLQHPGIVPVFDIGRLTDGRHYFTMKEVGGRTFRDVIHEVHLASALDRWETGPTGWNFRRLVDTLLKVCEAVAYAHTRGVVHRDLKPSNIMVGEFGEVLVMDWGLARVQGEVERQGVQEALRPVVTVRTGDPQMLTQVGKVAGTLAYMPPEQARGEVDRLGSPSDVYSLGAVLYELLEGEPPYHGLNEWVMLEQVQAGRWRRPHRGAWQVNETATGSGEVGIGGASGMTPPGQGGPPLPEELVEICGRAMSSRPEDRFPDASQLGNRIKEWLEQARRRERGLAALDVVLAMPQQMDEGREKAQKMKDDARAFLAQVPTWEEVEKKKPGWVQEDEAARLLQEVDLDNIRYTQALRGALNLDPDLPEAHAALAAWYHQRHVEAEMIRDTRSAAQWELLLREHDRRGEYAAYLKGDGAVTLVTDPPGAEVHLFKYETVDRRLVPHFVKVLGRTPLQGVPMERGSYLLKIRAPGRVEVLYPVYIERGYHWDGIPPEGGEPYPIPLPHIDELGPDDCYVPAGWFWAGGDEKAHFSLPRLRVWLPGLVVNRFPITNIEYVDFLNDLVTRGFEAQALRHAPHFTAGRGEDGALGIPRGADGLFVLGEDPDGDVWAPNEPIAMIDWVGASSYAKWRSEREGISYRLPSELEWEKGARGVDGRIFPWGNSFEPSWACTRDNHRGRPSMAPVDSYEVDQSLYGIRGLAGNVRDWCGHGYDISRRYHVNDPAFPALVGRALIAIDILGRLSTLHWSASVAEVKELLNTANRETVPVLVKGGDWMAWNPYCRVATRNAPLPGEVHGVYGFRLVRSYP